MPIPREDLTLKFLRGLLGKSVLVEVNHPNSIFAMFTQVLSQNLLTICTGVMVIDIGGGTTEVGIQMNGATYFTGVVPIGGKYVTGDIAAVLRLSNDIAEKIKVNQGACHESLVDDKEVIEIPVTSGSFGERTVSRLKVCEIAKARMWEIFTKVKRAVEDAKTMQYVPTSIFVDPDGNIVGEPVLGADFDKYRETIESNISK